MRRRNHWRRDLTDEEFKALFRGLFEDHHGEIAGYLRRRLDRSVADELAAQTFTEAWDRRASYDPSRGSARAWLFGIATNLLRHHRRSEERRLRAYSRFQDQQIEPRNEGDEVCGRLDLQTANPTLAAALASLSPTDRDALLLFAWVGLSYPEIATAAGIPTGTVKSRINRARQQVR